MSLKINVAILFLLLSFTGFTQRNGVVRFSNNAGYRVLGWNPAEMMNYSGKVDVNLFSFSGLIFASSSPLPSYGLGSNFQNSDILNNLGALEVENTELLITGAFELPSFMLKLNDNHAIGFSSSFRTSNYISISEVSIFNALRGVYSASNNSSSFNQQFMKGLSHTWLELGFSYAGKVFENDQSYLSVGTSLKYIKGASSGYFDASDISLTFIEGRDLPDFSMRVSYAFDQGMQDLVEDFELTLKSKASIAGDIGVSYIIKDQEKGGHRFRFGASVVDLGRLKYTAQDGSENIDISVTGLSAERFSEVQTMEGFVDTLRNSFSFSESQSNGYTMYLPTSFILYADAKIIDRVYCGLEFNNRHNLFQLIDSEREVLNVFNVSPRYEGKRFTAMLPMAYNDLLKYSVGIGFQTRYFTIGSSNIFTELGSERDFLALNLWLGFQWQIYCREPKTQDR